MGEHRRSAAHSVTAAARQDEFQTLWRAELERARRRRRQVEIAADLLLLVDTPTTPFAPRAGARVTR
jgi:hypothetical protein